MIKKQRRNNTVSCLFTDCNEGGFPPLIMAGKAVREHSICEVMDNTTLSVKAIYKLHEGVWYRYDLANQWPPPPPPPPPPTLAVYINLGLTVPNMPVMADGPNVLIPSGYQKWNVYPVSPVLTSVYPYQFLNTFNNGTQCMLYVSATPFYKDGAWDRYKTTSGHRQYIYNNISAWVFVDTYIPSANTGTAYPIQSNYNIYTSVAYSTVHFAKTTTATQDINEISVPTYNPNLISVSVAPVTINKTVITPTIPTIAINAI